MVATQSDNDDFDDEVGNLCLMELDDSKITSISCESNVYTFDELQDAFKELAIDFETMNMKYKKMIAKLNVENENLSKVKIDLEKSNDSMKIEIANLTKKNANLQNSFFQILYKATKI